MITYVYDEYLEFFDERIRFHENAINILYVACGEAAMAQEVMQPIMLAILFSRAKLNVHLVVEKEELPVLEAKVQHFKFHFNYF